MAKKKTSAAPALKGWAAIAKFMGTTPTSAQTWAKHGMPVRHEGRFVVADRAEVEAWLGTQMHMPKPAHILTGDADIAAGPQRFYFCHQEKRRIESIARMLNKSG